MKGSLPEQQVRHKVRLMLLDRGWYVLITHGSMYQSGFPDLFATHSQWGQRWVEIKLPHMQGSRFTPAQMDTFPKLCANGSGVWILTGNSNDEYQELFKPPNWLKYHSIWKMRGIG